MRIDKAAEALGRGYIILKTVTRILMERDSQPNRSAAYLQALARAEVIAIRCVRRG